MLLYTSLSVLLFSALALIVPSGFSLGAVMLLLGSAVLLRRSSLRFRLQGEDRALIFSFVAYFVVTVAMTAVHHGGSSEYDPPLRFLLAIPALLLLLAYPPRAAAFWVGLAIGGAGAGLLSLWQLHLGIDRPGGSTNPIQYGNIAIVLAITCSCGFSWAREQRRAGGWVLLLAVGMAGGLVASFISGSRGSWIAAPVCMVPALFVLSRGNGGAMVRNLALGAVVVVAALWFTPQTGLRARTELAVTEAQNYAHKNDTETAGTSVGARLEMWRIGLLMIPQRPLLGWGKQGLIDYKIELVAQGKAAPGALDHTHLHNEYLDAQVKRGIPGLLALLVLYGVPLVLFARRACTQGPARRYAMAGVLLYLSYATFGLTQSFMTHNNGVMILAFMTAILWALVRTTRDDLSSRY